LLILLPAVGAVSSVDETFASCFNRTTRRSIDNYPPIAEFTRTTAVQCMRECVIAAGNRNPVVCRSFTFERFTKKCQLYDHDGSQLPAVVFPANDIDLFVRMSTQGSCGGSLATHPHFHRHRENFHVMRETEEETRASEIDANDITGWPKDIQPANIRESSLLPGKKAATQVHDGDADHRSRARAVVTHPRVSKGESFEKDEHKGQSVQKVQKIKSVSTTTKAPKEHDIILIIAAEMACSNGEGYYVVLGNQIVAPANQKTTMRSFEKIEQGECGRLCTDNKTPKKERFECKSINYFPSKRRCEMFSILSEPHGPGNLLENRHSIYAEKFCISELADDCDPEEVFILHVQKTMKSKAEETLRGDSITSCLEKCFSRKFCRSVVFDSAKHQCRLHKDSPGDARNNVVETSPGVVLIENGCRRNAKPIDMPKSRGLSRKLAKNSIRRAPEHSSSTSSNNSEFSSPVEAEWGDWSECTFKSAGKRFRVRTKNCEEGDESAACRQNGMELENC
ncbi:hypothetical protein PMAYCL1PPCAC_31420, partial [Pristionchus mayeri]